MKVTVEDRDQGVVGSWWFDRVPARDEDVDIGEGVYRRVRQVRWVRDTDNPDETSVVVEVRHR